MEDEGTWFDLDTLSVDVKTSRVRARTTHEPEEDPEHGRLMITVGPKGTTVRDVAHGAGQTFHEAVRWVGGYLWSSGDLLLSSDRRIARIEFTSTDPTYVGSIIWTQPPLAGHRGTALLIGQEDRSPNETQKLVAFAGWEETGDAPVEIAVIEALARESHRFTIAPTNHGCSHREVRLIAWRPRELVVIVACPEGALVEHHTF